jgi:hypothetical protein
MLSDYWEASRAVRRSAECEAAMQRAEEKAFQNNDASFIADKIRGSATLSRVSNTSSLLRCVNFLWV